MSEKRDARERFVELANKRVTKTIKDLRLVGNLSNQANLQVRRVRREKDHPRLTAGAGCFEGAVPWGSGR